MSESLEDRVHKMLDLDFDGIEIDDVEDYANKLLDIKTENLPSVEVIFHATQDETDLNDDYRKTRQTLYNLIETGEQLLKRAIRVVEESDAPRTIEVTTNLIVKIAELSEKLMDLQKTRKEAESDSLPSGGPKQGSVTNNTSMTFVNAGDDLSSVLEALQLPGKLPGKKEKDITPRK